MTKFRQILSKDYGFTLIEFIVTMLVICIILGGIGTCGFVFSNSGLSKNTGVAKQVLEDGTIYRPLVKIPEKGNLGGVCSGIAYKFGIDPWIPRIGFLVGTFVFGGGLLVYVVMALLLDSADTPDDYMQRIGS